MLMLLLGTLVLIASLYGIKRFSQANSVRLSRVLKKGLSAILLVMAGLAALRGRIDLAALLFPFALGLWGWGMGARSFLGRGFLGRGSRGGGSFGRRFMGSAFRNPSQAWHHSLYLALWHEQDGLEGEIQSGSLQGRRLSSLSQDELEELQNLCNTDSDSRILLKTYLDSLTARGRKTDQASDHTRRRRPAQNSTMTKEEARQILGLDASATPDNIRRAHRALMKKLHPDQGGTTYLATRINQARDTLLEG
jgi:hypothetical protein